MLYASIPVSSKGLAMVDWSTESESCSVLMKLLRRSHVLVRLPGGEVRDVGETDRVEFLQVALIV